MCTERKQGGSEEQASAYLDCDPWVVVCSICPLDYGATNIAKQPELLLNIYATILGVLKKLTHIYPSVLSLPNSFLLFKKKV